MNTTAIEIKHIFSKFIAVHFSGLKKLKAGTDLSHIKNLFWKELDCLKIHLTIFKTSYYLALQIKIFNN